MQKQKTPRGSRPIKTIRRGDVQIDFNPIGGFQPSGTYYYDKENRYQPLYPSIYSIKIQGHGFFPFWDHFTDKYFEDYELISPEQMLLFTYLCSLRNRGVRLSIMGSRTDGERRGLAAMLGRNRMRVIADLDHLEDCLLIHRVRRLDLHGTPNDIIVHTPYTPKELTAGGMLDVIKDRIQNGATRNARAKNMISGVNEEGQHFAYLHRKGGPGRFHYDARQILDAFGQHTARFADWALTFFRKNFHYLFTDKPAFDEDYRSELRLELKLYGVEGNAKKESCYAAAAVFRKIYCPSFEELVTV